ncbi:hypothetical protein EJ110_NYTH52742 [Nymphaea thermarum]|nr:hypothetical protein EJ110_NYTH52742 [Nymphaea thermarum]
MGPKTGTPPQQKRGLNRNNSPEDGVTSAAAAVLAAAVARDREIRVGVTHYFSILKARQELGYEPLVSPRQGMAETIAYWQEMKRRTVNSPPIYVWLFCIIGMLIVICSAVVPYPYLGPFECVRTVCLFVFRSLLVVRLVAAVASSLHILEAGYAWYLARRVDPPNAKRWPTFTFEGIPHHPKGYYEAPPLWWPTFTFEGIPHHPKGYYEAPPLWWSDVVLPHINPFHLAGFQHAKSS